MAVLTIEHKSPTMRRDMPLKVVLPFDREGVPPYPLVVLLHGLQGNCNTWLYNTRIERWACDRNLAVAMPQGDNGFWIEPGVAGGPQGDYGAYIVEVTQLMRDLFPVANDREHTFVGGFSMGGYGALRAALLWPELYSKALVFSAACHFFEEDEPGDMAGELRLFEPREEKRATDLNPRWLAERLGREAGRDLFPAFKMLVGADDSLARCNAAMAQCLAEQGASVQFEERPGIHSWNFVQGHLEEGLDWLAGGARANEGSLD